MSGIMSLAILGEKMQHEGPIDEADVGQPLPILSKPVLISMVAAKMLAHVPGLFRYGYFRDELYFLDCARHLDWGYVDCAPLVAVYAKIALLLGGSLPSLRVLSMLAGAGMVALTVLIARQLGGGVFAQALAGLGIIIAPVHLMIDSILSMNAFEPLFWMGCIYVLIRIIRGGDPRLWLAFGVLAGLGLENKHSTLFFGAAVAVAILATGLRRELLKPWIWLGGLVALLVFLPNIVWQWQHGFPTLEDLQNVRAIGKNVELAPIPFFLQQVLMMHPANLPLWLAGLWFLLFGRGRAFRALGLVYLSLLALFMFLHAKDYYLAPAYPMLLAAGGVAIETWSTHISGTQARSAARSAIAGWLVLSGAILAPIALPLLSPAKHVAYQKKLGLAPPKTEVAHVGPLPQPRGGALADRDLRQQLRRGRCHQPLWPGVRASGGDLRPPDPLHVGARRFRRRPADLAAVGTGVARRALRHGRGCRRTPQSVGHGRGKPADPALPRSVTLPRRAVARTQALELKESRGEPMA
jgi:hypothetical protein